MMTGSLAIRRSAKCATALAAALAVVGIAEGVEPSMVTWPSQVQADSGKSLGAFWLVQAIEGSAEVRRAAEGLSWTNLAVGQLVEPGSEIRTSSAGRVALVSGRDTLNITPSSRVELPAPVQPASVQIYQWFGEVTYEIGKRPAFEFEVDTPHLAAVVKGTKFTVDVGEDDSVVDVSEGLVQVAANGDRRSAADVAVGQAATVGASAPDHVSVGPGKSGAAQGSATGKAKGAAKNSNGSANDASNGKANGNANGNGNGNGKREWQRQRQREGQWQRQRWPVA